jgi:hypothetical protein
MTEAEWLAATDPMPMLEFLRGKASDRKIRLLLCAIGRLMPDCYVREEEAAALQIAERYADSQATLDELNHCRNQLKRIWVRNSSKYVPIGWSSLLVCSRRMVMQSCFELCSRTVRARIVETGAEPTWERDRQQRQTLLRRERPIFARLLCELLGNPFRPMLVNPDWLTSTVVSLAEGIYADRSFDRLPILADALQDAGCENDDILDHCRQPGEHVRGCWVVDLLTGRG